MSRQTTLAIVGTESGVRFIQAIRICRLQHKSSRPPKRLLNLFGKRRAISSVGTKETRGHRFEQGAQL